MIYYKNDFINFYEQLEELNDNIANSEVVKALAFVEDYCNYFGKNSRAICKPYENFKPQTEHDIKQMAFYVEDLIIFFKQADQTQKTNMIAFLNIFQIKLCGDANDDDYQSVQYLANSGKQERILSSFTNYLERNTEATHAKNIADKEEKYHYLVPKNLAVNEADFKYKKDNNIKVDAKIYGNISSMYKNYNKKTHNANFLIVYLKYPVQNSINYCNNLKNKKSRSNLSINDLINAANFFNIPTDSNNHWLFIDLNSQRLQSDEVYLDLHNLIKILNEGKDKNITLFEKTDFQ